MEFPRQTGSLPEVINLRDSDDLEVAEERALSGSKLQQEVPEREPVASPVVGSDEGSGDVEGDSSEEWE